MTDTLIDIATQKIVEQGFNPATARAIAGIAASVFIGDAAIGNDADSVRAQSEEREKQLSPPSSHTLNLLPCPFCGAPDKEKAIAAWNTRAPVTQGEIPGNSDPYLQLGQHARGCAEYRNLKCDCPLGATVREIVEEKDPQKWIEALNPKARQASHNAFFKISRRFGYLFRLDQALDAYEKVVQEQK